MKVLIIGKNSFIGRSIKEWLDFTKNFETDIISIRNINLEEISFKSYEVIIHVAGIKNFTSKNITEADFFYVNKDLALKVAQKAKVEGVKKFIFTSSISVFGLDNCIGDYTPVNTFKPNPKSSYGKSKSDAENSLISFSDKNFKVIILRLPMVYGKDNISNFMKLVSFSKKFSFYPRIHNIRSVIHINNLCELVRLLLISDFEGFFHPQDKEYFSTNTFIKSLRFNLRKKTILIPFVSTIFKLLGLFIKQINKIYGNKFYISSISIYKYGDYQIESISSYIQNL